MATLGVRYTEMFIVVGSGIVRSYCKNNNNN